MHGKKVQGLNSDLAFSRKAVERTVWFPTRQSLHVLHGEVCVCDDAPKFVRGGGGVVRDIIIEFGVGPGIRSLLSLPCRPYIEVQPEFLLFMTSSYCGWHTVWQRPSSGSLTCSSPPWQFKHSEVKGETDNQKLAQEATETVGHLGLIEDHRSF